MNNIKQLENIREKEEREIFLEVKKKVVYKRNIQIKILKKLVEDLEGIKDLMTLRTQSENIQKRLIICQLLKSIKKL